MPGVFSSDIHVTIMYILKKIFLIRINIMMSSNVKSALSSFCDLWIVED